jgi:hypothetical protein
MSTDAVKKPILPSHAGGEREPFIMVTVGQQGVGKSYQNEIIIRQTVSGTIVRNPETGMVKQVPPRRALILDNNDEYTKYKAIHLKDIRWFSAHKIIEARRVRPFRDDGQPMNLDDMSKALATIIANYRGGLLVVEDLNAFTADTMKQDLIGALCTVRHKAVDVLVSLQGLGRITPKLWQNIRWLRIHKVQESVSKHAKKFEEKEEYLTIAENIINAKYDKGDERMFLNVDCRSGKMFGRYTQKEFQTAALDYIYENRRKTIDSLLNRRDLNTGGLKHTETDVIKMALEKITKSYSQYSSK